MVFHSYNSKSTVLLVLDMQEYFRNEAVSIISNVKAIVETCHAKGIPVFWTQYGQSIQEVWLKGKHVIKRRTVDWNILSELQSMILPKTDFVITNKTRYSAFHNTELNSFLMSLGTRTIIISGLQTNLCCESTARNAVDNDYNVIFLKDATSTENKILHDATLLNLEFGIAKIASVAEVIDWLRESRSCVNCSFQGYTIVHWNYFDTICLIKGCKRTDKHSHELCNICIKLIRRNMNIINGYTF